MTSSFHLITWKEGKYYVGKILENNISSFGKTEKECEKNTREALELYFEENLKREYVPIKSARLLKIDYTYA